MMQNAAYQRALLLLEHNRFADAEQELRQGLLESPHDAMLHAVLAVVLTEQLKFTDATSEAEQAITLDPDDPYSHYALALVLRERNRFADALVPLNEAIRLDPFAPRQYALLAQIKLDQRNWHAALEAANKGLEIDPSDNACVNLRGIALTNLGRNADASQTIEGALQRDPHNATTHANQGWALLHQNQPKPAMEHFREALRIDPSLDWARAGIVEAMKARNPFYRVMLAYFLFMTRQSGRMQWGIIIGGWLGYRFIANYQDAHPEARPFLVPIMVAYAIFALSSWLAPHLFNLMLRIDRFGRYALSDTQRIGANIVGSILAVAVGVAIYGIAVDHSWLMTAALIGILSLPASLIMISDAGWPRWTLIGLTAALATCVALVILIDLNVVTDTIAPGVAQLFQMLLLVAVFAGQLIAGVRLRK